MQNGHQLTISFHRRLQADAALTLRVSAANALVGGTWSTLATKTGGAAWVASPGVTVSDDPSTGAVTVFDSQVFSDQPRRFLRITAELTGN